MENLETFATLWILRSTNRPFAHWVWRSIWTICQKDGWLIKGNTELEQISLRQNSGSGIRDPSTQILNNSLETLVYYSWQHFYLNWHIIYWLRKFRFVSTTLLVSRFPGWPPPDARSEPPDPQNSTLKQKRQIELKLSGLIDNIPTKMKILSRIIYQSFEEVIQDLPRTKFWVGDSGPSTQILNNSLETLLYYSREYFHLSWHIIYRARKFQVDPTTLLVSRFSGTAAARCRSGPAGPQISTLKEKHLIELKLSIPIDNMPTKMKKLSRIIYKSFQRVIQDLARGSRIPDPKFGRREICYNSVFPSINEPSFWYIVDIL
jgi:hypothetical protein